MVGRRGGGGRRKTVRSRGHAARAPSGRAKGKRRRRSSRRSGPSPAQVRAAPASSSTSLTSSGWAWSRSPPSSRASSISAGPGARWARGWPTRSLSSSAAPGTSSRSRCSEPGAVLVLRPMLPAVQPFRTGALCLGAALCLGLAAGSLGLGAGETPRTGRSDTEYLRSHGGAVGERALLRRFILFEEVGRPHPVLVPPAGGPPAADRRIGGRHREGDPRERRLHHPPGPQVHRGVRRGTAHRAHPPAPDRGADRPPEVEPVVRATHVEVPSEEEDAEEFDIEDEPEVDEVEAFEEEARACAGAGARRRGGAGPGGS